jgi:ribonucleoside-diphosphate reductase alpha chain
LKGQTIRVPLTQGKMYITINHDRFGLREVIVNVGKGGTETSASAEAIGRMISNQLKFWVDVESIISSLKNIHGTPSWVEGNLFKSMYDAIARVLEEYLELSVDCDVLLCEVCNSPNVSRSGSKCYSCVDCGHSSCT